MSEEIKDKKEKSAEEEKTEKTEMTEADEKVNEAEKPADENAEAAEKVSGSEKTDGENKKTDSTEDASENDSDKNSSKADKKSDKEEKSSGLLNDICEMVETVLLCMLVFLVFRTYVVDQARVDGPSMQPNFYTDDRVLYNRIYSPKRGDIVIIDATRQLNEALIKRVIAVEGDVIDIRDDGFVYVNGEQVNEQIKNGPDDKLTKDYFISSSTTSKDNPSHTYPLTIPEGYVFVMGDNRIDSMDSRSAWVDWIPEEDIVGKVFCRFYRTKENKELYGKPFSLFF